MNPNERKAPLPIVLITIGNLLMEQQRVNDTYNANDTLYPRVKCHMLMMVP